MALLKIAQLGHPVLREKAKSVTPEEIQTGKFQEFIDSMFATLKASNRPGWNSVGLSGNQVYTLKRVFILDFVVEDEKKDNAQRVKQVFINPEILETSEETGRDFESCLSLMDISGIVERPQKIKVKALNRNGEEFELEACDFYARLILHETDHLNGVLFVDRMEDMRSLTFTENLHEQYSINF